MPKRRTTLFLDDETVRHAQLLMGAKSQSAVVQMALEKLIRTYSARRMPQGTGIAPEDIPSPKTYSSRCGASTRVLAPWGGSCPVSGAT